MEHNADLKDAMDKIEALAEEQARFCLKALLLTERITPYIVLKAIDLAACVKQ